MANENPRACAAAAGVSPRSVSCETISTPSASANPSSWTVVKPASEKRWARMVTGRNCGVAGRRGGRGGGAVAGEVGRAACGEGGGVGGGGETRGGAGRGKGGGGAEKPPPPARTPQ